MGFSYFSYNQDYNDQEKREVPSFSLSDYNDNIDERRDLLGIDFFNLNHLVLSLYKEECSKNLNMDHGDDQESHKIAYKPLNMNHGDDQESHKIAYKPLNMNHGDDDDYEGPRKIERGCLKELMAELVMDNEQSSCLKVQKGEDGDEDDQDSLKHHNDKNKIKFAAC